MPEAEAAVVCHAMAGRTRIRIGTRRGDPAFFAALADALERMPSVFSVEVSPLTGGAVIRHQGAFADIAAAAAEAGLFALVANGANAAETEPPGARTSGIETTVPALEGRHLLALFFIGLAVVQLLRGQVLSPALTLAWYALAVLRRSRLAAGD